VPHRFGSCDLEDTVVGLRWWGSSGAGTDQGVAVAGGDAVVGGCVRDAGRETGLPRVR